MENYQLERSIHPWADVAMPSKKVKGDSYNTRKARIPATVASHCSDTGDQGTSCGPTGKNIHVLFNF